MTKRTDRALDSDELNPSGTARRRLLKALGLGAVATQLTLDWSQPTVRFGSLPAHAAGSAGCVIGLWMTFSGSAPDDLFTAQITVNNGSETSLFTELPFTGSEPLSFSTADALSPSQTVNIGVNFIKPDSGIISYTASAQCCTATASESGERNETTSGGLLFEFAIGTQDPGECSILDPL